jgi:hypothetical protein
MKKLIVNALLALFITSTCVAQNMVGSTTDAGRIALNVVVADNLGNMEEDVVEALSEKLSEIATMYASAGSEADPRFIITAKVLEQSKSVTNTVPVMFAYNLKFNFYIGDGIDGIKFETTSVSAKGVGKSEQKAYLMALNEVDVNSDQFRNFVENGKKKIMEYYNSKCDFIIKDAQTAAGQNDFDGAIYKLMSVPDVCKDCYSKCMNAVPVVFHQKLEHDCQVLIARAKTLIAQNQYDQAAETLSSILPDISCYPTADQMMRDINDHRCSVALGAATAAWAAKNVNATSNALSSISADSKCSADANRIAEEVRAYVRQQENREWQFKLLDHNDRVDLTKMTIKAARAVGVAYASRRTKVVYNTTIISRW